MDDLYRARVWSLDNLHTYLSMPACYQRSEKTYTPVTGPQRVPSMKGRSFLLAAASVIILILAPDHGWCQQREHFGRFAPKATAVVVPPQEKPAATDTARAPTLDPSSHLGQALAACDKLAETGSFALPGLKTDITLDRCYKGRDNLVCVFNAMISEAKSLTDSFTKIVDVKYPDFNTVENICKLKRDALATDMSGAEDFTKRFSVLQSEYEAGTKCAASVKQEFKDVVLTDMAQPPEILKSMNESMDADVNRVSQTENQAVELAAKIQAASKAMRTIEKIHRAMCVNEKTVTGEENVDAIGAKAESSAAKGKKEARAPKN
jgi:hypothetical protein